MIAIGNKPALANCPACAKLFVGYAGQLCAGCRTAKYKDMENVIEYARARPGVAIPEIAQALKMTKAKIMTFADEGLFRRYGVSTSYPCRLCQTEITFDCICRECKEKLSQQINDLQDAVYRESGRFRPVEAAGTIFEVRVENRGRKREDVDKIIISTRRERDKKVRRSIVARY